MKSKNSKSPTQKPILNGKSKNAYSNFIKNIRATTPVLNSLSNSNLNSNKNRIRPTSSFTRTLNNFFQRNKLLINDDDDKSSFINDDPIKLRNQFQHYLGKANEKTTKEKSKNRRKKSSMKSLIKIDNLKLKIIEKVWKTLWPRKIWKKKEKKNSKKPEDDFVPQEMFQPN